MIPPSICHFQTQDFSGREVHSNRIVAELRRLHCMSIPREDED